MPVRSIFWGATTLLESDDAMMDRPPDPYAVLGVAHDASQDEISRAFRALLRRHHPDTRDEVSAADTSDLALRDVVAAYGVLRDPIRRAAYDSRLLEQNRRMSHEVPRVAVAVRGHRSAPEPPIVAGPVIWQRPAAG
jgi:curved DNA-binding protein CbpA